MKYNSYNLICEATKKYMSQLGKKVLKKMMFKAKRKVARKLDD